MPHLSRTWRFVVTNLDGETITLLDGLATNRTVTPLLGDALQITGQVPSDNPRVNISVGQILDGWPFLAEGVRQIYGLRDESDPGDPTNYVPRASTLVMQVGDAAQQDDAITRFTAYDPWQYMMSRPVYVSENTLTQADGSPFPAGTVAGSLIPDGGILYPSTMTADEIVMDIITTTVAYGDANAPLAALYCFIDYGQFGGDSTNIQETCAAFTEGWPIQQGTSLGQALKDLMASGYLDIVLKPIFDPALRSGVLCALEIYSQTLPNIPGAGSYRYNAIFAWDKPGRNLVGADDFFDGTGRANQVQFYSGQGGPPVPLEQDEDSVVYYGEYFVQQFFVATEDNLPAVTTFAAMQLALRSRGKQTLTINPVPERAPEPFIDYDLGDAVPEFMSNRMRQSLPVETIATSNEAINSATLQVQSTSLFLPTNGIILIDGKPVTYSLATSGQFFDLSSHAAISIGDKITSAAWQRVYGIPIQIDDNGVETVRELLVGPVGPPA